MFKGLAVAIGFAVTLVGSSLIDTYYTINGTVNHVNENEVVAVDSVGYEWVFYGDEVKQGDTIKMIFDSNHTNSRLDDIVVDFKVIK